MRSWQLCQQGWICWWLLLANLWVASEGLGQSMLRSEMAEGVNASSLGQRPRSQGLKRPQGNGSSWPAPAVALRSYKEAYALPGSTKPKRIHLQQGAFVRRMVLQGEDFSAIMMDALASDLYAAAGVRVPACRYYPCRHPKECSISLCRWMDGLQMLGKNLSAEVRTQVSQHFVLDALLQNYDMHSMTNVSNIALDEKGQVVRVDNGGSLAADALGNWKATDYHCSAHVSYRQKTWSKEPFSLWDWRIISNFYSGTYVDLVAKDLMSQVHRVVGMQDTLLATIDKFITNAAPGMKGAQHEAARELKHTLRSRIACLERVAKRRPDLLSARHTTSASCIAALPNDVCEGVRSECRDLLL